MQKKIQDFYSLRTVQIDLSTPDHFAFEYMSVSQEVDMNTGLWKDAVISIQPVKEITPDFAREFRCGIDEVVRIAEEWNRAYSGESAQVARKMKAKTTDRICPVCGAPLYGPHPLGYWCQECPPTGRWIDEREVSVK